MATVSITPGNYIRVSDENRIPGEYTDVFGKIINISHDEQNPQLHWVTIQTIFSYDRDILFDGEIMLSSSELSQINFLRVFDVDEGTAIHQDLINHAASQDEVPVRAEEPDEAEENVAEESRSEEERQPLVFQEVQFKTLVPKRTDYKFPLSHGSIKNLLKVAEKNLDRVFPHIDEHVINAVGLAAIQALSKNMLTRILNKKLEFLCNYEKHFFKSGDEYTFTLYGKKSVCIFIGHHIFYVVESEDNSEAIKADTLLIASADVLEFFENIAKTDTLSQEEKENYIQDIISRRNELTRITNEENKTLYFMTKKENPNNIVNAKDLDANWQKFFMYAIIEDIPFDEKKIDLTSLPDWDTISSLRK